jgi:hypothetical protein
MGEIDKFSALNLKKFHMCSVDHNVGTVNVTTYALHSVSRQIFGGIPLVTHSADLTIATQLIHIFHLFTTENTFYKPPEKNQRNEVRRTRRSKNVYPFPVQRLGDFLSKKTRRRLEKWDGASSNRKTFPKGT